MSKPKMHIYVQATDTTYCGQRVHYWIGANKVPHEGHSNDQTEYSFERIPACDEMVNDFCIDCLELSVTREPEADYSEGGSPAGWHPRCSACGGTNCINVGGADNCKPLDP